MSQIVHPSIVTPSLLNHLRKHPHLPQNTWYFVAATVLCAINRPDEIAAVYEHALEHASDASDANEDYEEKLKISRRVREALVKASTIGGLPKTINALSALKAATPPELQDQPGKESATSRRADMYKVPVAELLERGQDYFEMNYGKVASRVMNQLDGSGTEDLGLVARLTYSHILSNVSVLNPAETSYVLIAGLIPQDVNPQLKGHLRGAMNGGATKEEVRAVRDIAIRICEYSGMTRLENNTAGWGWREEVANV